jgi:hypothetical protein
MTWPPLFGINDPIIQPQLTLWFRRIQNWLSHRSDWTQIDGDKDPPVSHGKFPNGIRQTPIRSLQPQGQDKIAEVVIQQRSGRFQGGNVITHVPVRGPEPAARSGQQRTHTADL